jgi:hypothetical protein
MAKTTILGSVAVDSGQLIIVDPCYLREAMAKGFDDFYEKVCAAAMSGPVLFSGIGGVGMAINNFGGDGSYEVTADFATGLRLRSITIHF